MHSVVTSIALLAIVMLVTIGRKPSRKVLLGLPIGTFLHHVFDGAFTNTEMFWWPIGGWEFSAEALPVVARAGGTYRLKLLGGLPCGVGGCGVTCLVKSFT